MTGSITMMETLDVLSKILLLFQFTAVKTTKASVCLYPKALYNGDCVTCPANTLYQNLGSLGQNGNCVYKCSGSTQLISGKTCQYKCMEGNEYKRGEVKYCRDKYLNIGFCPVNNCPQSAPVCYFMQCLLTCPMFSVQYDNSCLIECFKDRPFVHNGVCVKECPSEENVIENGLCLTKCSAGLYLSGNVCLTSCLENQYIENNICVSNCSTFTMLEGRHCVNNCSQNRYVSGNKCVTQCPNVFFENERLCVASCPNNTVTEDNKCLNSCSPGRYLFGSKCLIKCPNKTFVNETGKVCMEQCVNGYTFKKDSYLLCLQSCPDLTVMVNGTCKKKCSKDNPFYLEGFCLQTCPNSSIYILAVVSPFDMMMYKCVPSCPKYVSVNKLCVDTCLPNEVLCGNECQSQCPVSDPVRVHLSVNGRKTTNITSTITVKEPISAFIVCAIKCPRDFFFDRNECYPDCLNAGRRMVYNSTCLEKCPDDQPYMTENGSKVLCSKSCDHLHFGMNCVENCPVAHKSGYKGECVNCMEIGMFSQGRDQECVHECRHFHFDNECYDYCPLNAQYMYNKTCFKTCPDNVRMIDNQNYGNTNLFICVQTCPAFKYTLNNRCVLRCPQSKRFIIKGKCMSCQDIGQFDDGQKCVEVCPEIGYNFHCYQQCPYNTKLYNKSCVMTCPSEMPLQLWDQRKGHYCGTECPEEYFILENQCVWFCLHGVHNYYIYNGTCLDKCPSQASYIWKFEKHSQLFSQCLEKCEDGKVKLHDNCYDSCPDNYIEFRGYCVLYCPKEVPFTYRGSCVANCTHYKLGLSCVDDCPSNLFRDNNTCVVTCPAERHYIYDRNCVESCKNYIYMIGKNCYNKCPPSKVEFERQCLDDCPKLAQFNNKGLCVSSCPNMTRGKHCYDSCLYNMKTYKNECVEKCPDISRFTNEDKCVDNCPFYFNSNFECIGNCPENTYPHGQQCKTDCPAESPFLQIGFLSKKCLASCGSYHLAAENMTCMRQDECKGYIDDSWCRKKCLLHTYTLHSDDKNTCKSLYPVYVLISLLIILILADIAFGVRIMIFRRKVLKADQNKKKEELEMGEINLLFNEED